MAAWGRGQAVVGCARGVRPTFERIGGRTWSLAAPVGPRGPLPRGKGPRCARQSTAAGEGAPRGRSPAVPACGWRRSDAEGETDGEREIPAAGRLRPGRTGRLHGG